jgi:hypothetical protein
MVEMKVLLALVARHYAVTCDNNTEWDQAIGKVPRVSHALIVGWLLQGCVFQSVLAVRRHSCILLWRWLNVKGRW